MAKTYSYTDALNFVGANYSKVLTDAFGALLADQTNSMIWNAADWRVALGSFDPFYLSPLEQDYGAPTVQVPTDLMGLRTATLVYAGNQPPVMDPLDCLRQLPKTNLQGLPNALSYEPSVRKFRVHPRPPSSIGSTLYSVEGTYKRTPSKVAADTLAQALPFEDAYFHVFTAGLLYRYFVATANPNAGQVQTSRNGRTVYTGQLGAFVAALNEMAADEALNLGDVQIAPASPLVAGSLIR